MTSWTTQLIWRQSPTCYAVPFSGLASLLVYFLFLFFAGVGSDCLARQTLYCRVLRNYRDNTMIDRKWATQEGGGLGGYAGDCLMYPQLAPMNHATSAGQSGFRYWPSKYGAESHSPIVYTVQSMPAMTITIENDHTNQIDNILNSINTMFPTAANRSAISSLSVSFDSEGVPVITATTFDLGAKVAGTGVATCDANGIPIISYPDSTGFVPGYEPLSPDGSFILVYYDPNSVNNGYATRLSSLENVKSSALTYDSTTGVYDFSIPDYSAQLTAIRQELHYINTRNPEITVNPPDVIVNPEITVNPPAVTVNPTVTVTPDVTVNVTAPTQNDITVAIDNSEVVNSINDLSDEMTYYQEEIVTKTFRTTNTERVDLDPSTYSQEEQSLLDIANGWNTQIPVISNACNVAFNAAFGSVPSIPASNLVPISGINLFGFNIVIDLRPYASMFAWFRSFVLMLEAVWFIDSIWRTVTTALKV